MVAVSVFSGFDSSAWALASAVAMAPIVSLDRCIGDLHELEADGTGFGAFGPQAMPQGFLSILGDELLEVGLGRLMVLMGRAGLAIDAGQVRPAVRGAHI